MRLHDSAGAFWRPSRTGGLPRHRRAHAGIDGIELLRRLKARGDALPVIVMTGTPTCRSPSRRCGRARSIHREDVRRRGLPDGGARRPRPRAQVRRARRVAAEIRQRVAALSGAGASGPRRAGGPASPTRFIAQDLGISRGRSSSTGQRDGEDAGRQLAELVRTALIVDRARDDRHRDAPGFCMGCGPGASLGRGLDAPSRFRNAKVATAMRGVAVLTRPLERSRGAKPGPSPKCLSVRGIDQTPTSGRRTAGPGIGQRAKPG